MIIKELRHKYNLKELLKFLGIPRSSYYYTLNKLNKTDKYAKTKYEIKEIYHKHKGRYGYRRIHLELINKGLKINHKTVYRLMKELV